MKPWNYFIAVAGVASVIGLFVPLLTVKKAMFEQRLSARDLAVEGHHTNTVWEKRIPQFAIERLPTELRSIHQDVEDALLATRLMALAFAPGLMLLLIGLVSIYRGQLGRFAAGVAILASAVSIAATFALRWGIETYSIEHLTITLDSGAYIPALVGVIGIIGGIGGMTDWRPNPRQVV